MNRPLLLLTAALFAAFALTPAAHAEARTPAQVQAAKEFKTDSIHLWMKKAELKEAYSELKPFPAFTDTKKKIEGLKIEKTPNSDGIELALWSGRVTMARIHLTPERTARMGGLQGILTQLIVLFGQPNSPTPGSTRTQWKIEDASFSCQLTSTPEGIVIAISDTGFLNEGIFAHAVKTPQIRSGPGLE